MRVPSLIAMMACCVLGGVANGADPVPINGLLGSYYDTDNLSGPRVTRVDPKLAFAWATNDGPVAGVAPTTWSARWSGYIVAPASGSVTIATNSDDGIEVWIDRKLVIRNWTDHASTHNAGAVAMAAGQRYEIIVKYYNNYGPGVTRLLWSYGDNPEVDVPTSNLVAADIVEQDMPPGTGTGFEVSYYNNDAFSGVPISGPPPSSVNYNWGINPPITGITGYRWSGIWRGILEAPVTDIYTLTASESGCLLVYLDGRLVINRAQRGTNVTATFTAPLAAGSRHPIEIRFSNPDVSAKLSFFWSATGILPALVPASRIFSPTVDITPFHVATIDARVNPIWIAGAASRSVAGVEAKVAGSSTCVVRGGTQWYIDTASVAGLPPGLLVQPGQIREISVSVEGKTEARTISWETLDLANTYGIDPMTIRRGDSLLLTHEGSASEELEIDVDYHAVAPPLGDIATYTACSSEGQSFTLPGTCDVAYGANGKFVYRAAQTGTIAFTNSTFGDPIVGVGKKGYYRVVCPVGFHSSFTSIAGQSVPVQFLKVGTVVVKARVGGRLAGSLTVRVVGVDFRGPVACEILFERIKDVQASHPELVCFSADDDLALQCSINSPISGGQRLNLRPTNGSRPTLQARLGSDGPVIARQVIDTFSIESTVKHKIPIDAVYPDGSMLCSAKLIQVPSVPNLEVRMNCFKAGVSFVSGSVNMTINTSDFTPIPFSTTGSAWFPYQMIMGAMVGGGVCHSFVVYQDGVQVSY